MGIFSKLFGKKNDEGMRIGGMEDYMTLIRVYFQAAIAGNASRPPHLQDNAQGADSQQQIRGGGEKPLQEDDERNL